MKRITMVYNAENYRIEADGRFGKPALIVGALGLIVSLGGILSHRETFFAAYLTAWLFWLGIALGGLFLVMLHHLTGSVWSVIVRRIAEGLAGTIPILAVLFLPILLGIHDLYEWSHPEALHDAILVHKASWLNPTAFSVRAIIYLSLWSFLTWKLRKLSFQQDIGDSPSLKSRFLGTSAWGMILFSLSISFAAFDWLMSLTPHWFSTIYGVYFAMGSIMASLAMLIVSISRLQSKGALVEVINEERRHDLGKLFFAFIILWAYMAFSQYFLIWYANLPEETIFYHHRWTGSWKAVSLAIVFGHFVLPFFLLISRPAKRGPILLPLVSGWMLLMHYIDLYWNVMPTFSRDGASISPWHFSTLIGIGGITIYFFIRSLVKYPLVPVKDIRLAESINIVSK